MTQVRSTRQNTPVAFHIINPTIYRVHIINPTRNRKDLQIAITCVVSRASDVLAENSNRTHTNYGPNKDNHLCSHQSQCEKRFCQICGLQNQGIKPIPIPLKLQAYTWAMQQQQKQ